MKKQVIILILIAGMLAALSGCSSKEEKQATPALPAPAAPQQAGQASLPHAPVPADPLDEKEVVPLKSRMLEHVKAQEFGAIYDEASDGFRKVGAREQFVALWQQQLQQTGAFKSASEISHTVRPTDRFLLFIYSVKYEKMVKNLRLTFGRSTKGGKLELTGINQSDAK